MTIRTTVHWDECYARADAGGGVDVHLDVHVPAGVERPPVVLFAHGGGWRGGDKGSVDVAYLLEHGYAVASINYRFALQSPFPAQIHDCKAAVRYLRADADRLGVDAGTIVAAGASAGGHLVSLLGATNGRAEFEGDRGDCLDQSSDVSGVVTFFGPQDMLLRAETQPDQILPESSLVWDLLGGALAERRELAVMASPALQVDERAAPMLILQGDADRQVLVDQAERLAERLTEHGVRHELIIAPGLTHGDKRFYQPPYREPVLAFLRSVYGDPAEP